MDRRPRLFLGLYAASGAAALVYEVTWTRLLALQMGHTVAAASTVLAAFMGGLAVGAALAGAVDAAIGQARRLHVYAALELLVAGCAAALPLGLSALVPALAWAYADGTTPGRFALVRVALSLAMLGVPAAAMGATFPIAAGWYAGRRRGTPSGADAAGDAGALYAANTTGAALGSVAAGFWLIPALGIRATTGVGVALNLVAAAGAVWLAHAQTDAGPTTRSAPAPKPGSVKSAGGGRRGPSRTVKPPAVEPMNPHPLIAAGAAAVSGFSALVYEVVWTRLLALVIGPTVYAFATMAASFIAGLALGSAAGTRLARRSPRPAVWLAAMLMLTGVAAGAAAWFAASWLPLIVADQVGGAGAVFGRVMPRQAFGVGLLLLPMTMALGAAFPLALAVAASGAATVGRDASRVYAWNTLGAIAGALLAGFVLVPMLGLRTTIHATAIVGALGGSLCLAAILVAHPSRVGLARAAAASAFAGLSVIAAVLLLPPWDRDLLSSGAYKYAPRVEAEASDVVLRAGRLEYYAEGAAATVSVRRLAGTLSLAIDGKVDASNSGDMLTQRLLGLLPVLLHRAPQDVCVIGLGSGVTAASTLGPGTVRRLDVVEISPEVVAASRLFEAENDRVLAAPGVRLILGDGRTHLLLTAKRYDAIVSEPSNPWMAGVAALFTREFFEAARGRLKPGGLLCQWAHTYDISSDDLRSIVGTFATVFPQGTMWLVGEGDLLLIGTNGPTIEPHLENLTARAQTGRVPAMLSDVAIAADAVPFSLLSLFAGGPRSLARYGLGAAIQTDDRMALEFSAPRGIYGRTVNQNAATIRALAGSDDLPAAVRTTLAGATDSSWAALGSMHLKASAYTVAYDAFHQAVTRNKGNAVALRGLSDAAAGAQRLPDERRWLESLATALPANVPVRTELSRLLAIEGNFDRAVAVAEEAVRLAPDDPRPAEQLASVLADEGDGGRLAPLADELARRFPERVDVRYYHAAALFLSGRAAEAADEARRLVAADGGNARAQNLLGASCATLGQVDCARTAFQASLAANPRDTSTYVNFGLVCLQSGDPAAAAGYFAEALTIEPSSQRARDGLVQARTARGVR